MSESQLGELSEFAGSFDYSPLDAYSAGVEENASSARSANKVNASSIPLKISATGIRGAWERRAAIVLRDGRSSSKQSAGDSQPDSSARHEPSRYCHSRTATAKKWLFELCRADQIREGLRMPALRSRL